MEADHQGDWHGAAASALAWWQEAGVAVLVGEAPGDWLAPPPASPPPAAAPPGAAMPADPVAFAAWRIGDAAPEAGWSGVAIAASGPADAPVMILTDCPDRDDQSGGALLTGGAAGRLFVRMLAAIGLDRDAVHIAAVCAKRPVAGRMPGDMEARLGEIARHHVALAAPQRLLLLGNAASRAVLATDTLDARGILHPFNHKAGVTGVVATFHPRVLLDQPGRKAEAWRDLQRLVEGWTR